MSNDIKWGELIEHVPLKDCKDSLLFDNDTAIASVSSLDNRYHLIIEVHGDINVEYKGEHYRYTREFPTELKNKIQDGSAWGDPDLCILHNNWFELSIYEGNNYLGGDVFEAGLDEYEPNQLRSEMIDYAEESFAYWEDESQCEF